MRKFLFAMCVVLSGAAAGAAELDNSADAGYPRLANLRSLMTQPQGTMYSQGGFAPAIDGNAMAGPGYAQLDSPYANGCCGVWNGYQARPCGHHRHHLHGGRGCGAGCGGGCNSCGGGCGGGFGGGCFRHGFGGDFGGYGGFAAFGAGCGMGCGAPACGCAAPACGSPCRRHCCHLFGHHCRRNACGCGSNVGGCDSCQSGTGAPSDAPMNQGPAPAAQPEELQSQPGPSLQPTPAAGPEAPGPSAEQPRRFLLGALHGLSK